MRSGGRPVWVAKIRRSSLRQSAYCASADPLSRRVCPSTSTSIGEISASSDATSSFSASTWIFDSFCVSIPCLIEIALPTVAAILTILGYSLNDTIVVFDRVRENMRAKGARKRDPVDLVNASINETLPRTVLTSGTTLAVLTALLVLGGAVIRVFTIVLILGVVIGTYSSIFVASPALIEIQKRWRVGDAERKKERPQPATV